MNGTKKPKTPTYSLLIRSYALPATFVSLWLQKVDGAARSEILFGETYPVMAEELAAFFQEKGVAVEREASPYSPEPIKGTPAQRGLF